MRKTGVLVGLVLIGLSTGCAGLTFVAGEPHPEAVPMTEIVCGDELTIGSPEGVSSGRVPDGFDPVAVHRCGLPTQVTDEIGVWSADRRETLTGDLAALVAAFAEPNEAPTMGACPAIGWFEEHIWFEGADGTFVRASFPRDSCGMPRSDVSERIHAALDALTLTGEEVTRGGLIELFAATAAGCETRASVLQLAEAIPGGHPFVPGESEVVTEPTVIDPGATAEPHAVIPWEAPKLPAPEDVTGMRLCRYAPEAPGIGVPMVIGDAGIFSGLDQLDADLAGRALELAASAPRADICDEVATAFVVAKPLPAAASVQFTVELDGCRRMVGPDLFAYAAPTELVALLTP